MSVLVETGHINEYPYNHARILYGNAVTAVTATGELNNFQADLALTDQTYERWSPAVSGDSITATFPAQNVNAIALAAHSNLNPTVEIRTANGSFEEVTAYPFEGPTLSSDFALQDYGLLDYSPDNEAILFLIKPRYADAVRITLTYTGTAPTLGVLRVGNVLEMQRPFYQGHTPAILAADTTFRPNVSESGEWLGASLIRQGRSLGFSWKNLKAPWVRSKWTPFAQSLKTSPFIIAWNPERFAADCFYASTSTVPKPNNSGPLNYQSIDLNARAYSDGTDPVVENIAPSTFAEQYTFTRSTVATYYDIGGVLQTAAVDEPRFTYDPVTHESKGLLIEEARTNLLLWSEDFDDVAWTKNEGTVTAGAETSPDGSLGFYKFTPSTNSTLHFVKQVASTSGEPTHSIFVKAAGYTKVGFKESASTGFYAAFDLSSGVVIDSSASVAADIEEVGNGVFRISMFVDFISASQALDCRVLPPGYVSGDLNGVFAGDGTSGIYIWGAQLEAGSFPTSYIKTEGTQVTRAADDCLRTLGPEFNANELTFFCKTEITNSKVARIFVLSGPLLVGNFGYFALQNLGSTLNITVKTSGGAFTTVASTLATTGMHKLAVSLKDGVATAAIDGIVSSPVTEVISNGVQTLYIGKAAGDRSHEGTFVLSKGTLFPSALSAAELQALTAP